MLLKQQTQGPWISFTGSTELKSSSPFNDVYWFFFNVEDFSLPQMKKNHQFKKNQFLTIKKVFFLKQEIIFNLNKVHILFSCLEQL